MARKMRSISLNWAVASSFFSIGGDRFAVSADLPPGRPRPLEVVGGTEDRSRLPPARRLDFARPAWTNGGAAKMFECSERIPIQTWRIEAFKKCKSLSGEIMRDCIVFSA